MIDLVEMPKDYTWGSESDRIVLEIDGEPVTNLGLIEEDDSIFFKSASDEADQKIARHCFNELPKGVGMLRLSTRVHWPPEGIPRVICWPSIACDEKGQHSFQARIGPVLETWRGAYSAIEWLDQVWYVISRSTSFSRVGGPILPSDDVRCEIKDPSERISDALARISQDLFEVFSLATENMDAAGLSGTLATYFSFPPETRSACEQYLLYFGEFLRDIGIDNSLELREEAGRLLFSVTPQDKGEALDHIREALDVYLNLPAAACFVSPDGSEHRLEIQKLEATLLHLKSQMILAHAMLETKQATIEAQQERLDFQRQIVEGRILLESKKEQTEIVGDKEELLSGTIAITRYKGKGFEIDLAKVFRTLRGRFQRKK